MSHALETRQVASRTDVEAESRSADALNRGEKAPVQALELAIANTLEQVADTTRVWTPVEVETVVASTSGIDPVTVRRAIWKLLASRQLHFASTTGGLEPASGA